MSKGRLRAGFFPAGVFAIVIVLAASASVGCGGGEEITRARFRSQLVESGDGRIPRELAGCVTDGLFEALDQESIEVLYAARTADDVPAATRRRLARAIEACAGD